MDKFTNPQHPVGCIVAGPSVLGKSLYLSDLFLNIVNELDKIYIYSPSLHQDLYQKLIKSFTNHIPIPKIPNISNE